MSQKAVITFTEEAGLGQGIGFLTISKDDKEQAHYELNYCAEKPMHERFKLYTEDRGINLSEHLSKRDLARLNEAYFDFRTTNAVHTYLSIQLQVCEILAMAV